MADAEAHLPTALVDLLESLESHSPSLSVFPPPDLDTAGSTSSLPTAVLSISRRKEDYPSHDKFCCSEGFWKDDVDWWIVRPPAAELKLKLEALSPGLDGSVMHRLHALADQLVACGNEEESMVDVCLEMSHHLLFVLQSVTGVYAGVSSELEEAMRISRLILKLVWAFTWVETLLLEHDMLRDCSQEAHGPIPLGSLWGHISGSEAMRSISSRWGYLHSLWHPLCVRTEGELDLLRRVALLCCGQETEAVENFQAPDYWEGFEACFLCVLTSHLFCRFRFQKPGRLGYGSAVLSQIGNRCMYWLKRAERARGVSTERDHDHDHWPLFRLKVLLLQQDAVENFGRRDHVDISLGRLQNEVQQVDLQLRFDFPVPLPKIQYLKFDILEQSIRKFLFWDRHRNGWRSAPHVIKQAASRVIKSVPDEVLHIPDVAGSEFQTRYALSCLVLRGQQLISNSKTVEEGLDVFERCLERYNSGRYYVGRGVFTRSGDWRIFSSCQSEFCRDLEHMVDLDRAERIVAFLVKRGRGVPREYVTYSFMQKAWAVCGFSGPAMFMPGSVVPALSPSKAVLEAFWESYTQSCEAMWRGESRCQDLSTGNKLRFVLSWYSYFVLFPIQAVAATVSKLLAPNAEAKAEGESPGTGKAGGDIARQALLALESARNYRRKDFEAVNDWEGIKRAHQACGPGAVFVQFAGGFSGKSSAMGMFDHVCIVVQDEGVASCHILERIDKDILLHNVVEISNACLERDLENDCCRHALETLYDLLIRPLFQTFIRQSDREQNGNPHRNRKLVISAVGTLQDVPFSILRNKDSGCYLFQEVKLAFTPSFVRLDFCRLRYESLQERTLLAGAGAAVALGDPHYLPYQQIPLPGSRKEVDAICEMFDFCVAEHKIVKLLGDDATPQRLLECVKMPSAGVESGTQYSQAFVHIAAHGSGGKLGDHGTLFLSSATTGTRRRRRRRAAAQGKGEGAAPAQLGEGEGAAAKLGEGEGAAANLGEGEGAAAQLGEGEGAAAKLGEGEGAAANLGEGEGAAAQLGEGEGAAAKLGEGEGAAAEGEGMRDESAFSDEEGYEPEAALPSDALHRYILQQQASAAEGLDFLPRLLRSRSSDDGTSLLCDDIMFSGLEWCTYMVVLSACKTAVGVVVDNLFDVVSFSRAFMSAGVPCSVLAQWPVDDTAALDLMKLFYEALSQGQDACSALQSAMIKMHQAGKYTLHQIAPFVVTGLPTVCLPPQMRRGPAQ